MKRIGLLTSDTQMMTVSIWREEENDGRFEDYQVPARENQTVLDVVAYVQQHIDPTLSYRFACRVGMCGSCAMMVNGAPRWTCRTHVSLSLIHITEHPRRPPIAYAVFCMKKK